MVARIRTFPSLALRLVLAGGCYLSHGTTWEGAAAGPGVLPVGRLPRRARVCRSRWSEVVFRAVSPPVQLPRCGRLMSCAGGHLLVSAGIAPPYSADWTLGCIALETEDIDELRGLLPAEMRTDLLILPEIGSTVQATRNRSSSGASGCSGFTRISPLRGSTTRSRTSNGT